MVTHSNKIAHLTRLVAALPPSEQAIFARIFHVQMASGHLDVPSTMRDWVLEAFGDLEAVCHQHIVKVTNLITLDGALFNRLRGARPTDFVPDEDVQSAIERTRGGPFCHPETMTPVDVFDDGEGAEGRVRGQYCITASNIAKYDGFHGLVIFAEHNPLQISRERVHDYVDTAWRWAERAHRADPLARYFFLMWNCLWKGGASIVHGHMQVTLGRGMHYAGVEHWRRQALLYRLAHGANYFEDLHDVHSALGLAGKVGQTRVIASLTPVKERELLLIGSTPWVDDDDLKDAIAVVLQAYTGILGVQSFNLAVYQRPIGITGSDDGSEDWHGFPAMVRIVDRGDLQSRTTDVGCMELYGSSVVVADPFDVIEAVL